MPTAIVMGAGVTGLSTAYHLAKRRFGRIIVLDKGPIGDGSSSRAAGIITGLLWSETGVRTRMRALELYRELSNELTDYHFQQVGCLNLFDPASWPERQKLLSLYDRLGVRYEIFNAYEIQRQWPQLRVPGDTIGLHDPLGGYSEPQEYLPALTARLRELGVDIREHQPVRDLVVEQGRVTGVRTASEIIPADAVVSTIFAWTNVVLGHFGIRLPFKSFVHQRYVTEPLAQAPRLPAVNANPQGGYVRPASGGRLLVGVETPDREEFRVNKPDFDMLALAAPTGIEQDLHERFSKLVPALAGTAWQDSKVGLLTFSCDGEPIIGPIGALPGLYVGVAFHSGGFAYNPVSGQLLAEYVVEGKTSIDITTFAPDRFEHNEIGPYLQETHTQRNVVRRRH